MRDKDILRKEFRHKLAALSPIQRAALSAAIRAAMSGWPPFKSAKSLIAFHPMKGEPDLVPTLLKAISAGHSVGLVRTPDDKGNDLLEVRLWDGAEASLERHRRMPLSQPASRLPLIRQESWTQPRMPGPSEILELQSATAGLVLVPGLAFGMDGARLGHGAGWYDRFLAAHPALLRVGIGFGMQVRAGLPCTDWDQKMDFLITEEGVRRCQSQ